MRDLREVSRVELPRRVGSLLLAALALAGSTWLGGCKGDARKLRDLINKAQIRHGGVDRFQQMGTFYVEYDIDDYSQGTPQPQRLSVSQQGGLVRSEYNFGHTLVTAVASPYRDEGWKKIQTAEGEQVVDLSQPMDRSFAELYTFEITSLGVFRLQGYLQPPTPTPEGEDLPTKEIECRYLEDVSPGFESIQVDIREKFGDTWYPGSFGFVFDASGKLARLDKSAQVSPDVTRKTEVRYLDYKETSGFLVPYRVEYRVDGNLTQVYRMRQFKPHVYLEPDLFMDPRSLVAASASDPSSSDPSGPEAPPDESPSAASGGPEGDDPASTEEDEEEKDNGISEGSSEAGENSNEGGNS